MLHEYDPEGTYRNKLRQNGSDSVRAVAAIKIIGREFWLKVDLTVVSLPPFEVFIDSVSVEVSSCDNRFTTLECRAKTFAGCVFPDVIYPTLRWPGSSRFADKVEYGRYKDFILMDLLFS